MSSLKIDGIVNNSIDINVLTKKINNYIESVDYTTLPIETLKIYKKELEKQKDLINDNIKNQENLYKKQKNLDEKSILVFENSKQILLGLISNIDNSINEINGIIEKGIVNINKKYGGEIYNNDEQVIKNDLGIDNKEDIDNIKNTLEDVDYKLGLYEKYSKDLGLIFDFDDNLVNSIKSESKEKFLEIISSYLDDIINKFNTIKDNDKNVRDSAKTYQLSGYNFFDYFKKDNYLLDSKTITISDRFLKDSNNYLTFCNKVGNLSKLLGENFEKYKLSKKYLKEVLGNEELKNKVILSIEESILPVNNIKTLENIDDNIIMLRNYSSVSNIFLVLQRVNILNGDNLLEKDILNILYDKFLGEIINNSFDLSYLDNTLDYISSYFKILQKLDEFELKHKNFKTDNIEIDNIFNQFLTQLTDKKENFIKTFLNKELFLNKKINKANLIKDFENISKIPQVLEEIKNLLGKVDINKKSYNVFNNLDYNGEYSSNLKSTINEWKNNTIYYKNIIDETINNIVKTINRDNIIEKLEELNQKLVSIKNEIDNKYNSYISELNKLKSAISSIDSYRYHGSSSSISSVIGNGILIGIVGGLLEDRFTSIYNKEKRKYEEEERRKAEEKRKREEREREERRRREREEEERRRNSYRSSSSSGWGSSSSSSWSSSVSSGSSSSSSGSSSGSDSF